jgi:hypothetical protein
VAEHAGRPWQYFESPVRKDQRAREIATRDRITEGLVCVFATVEPCRSFRLAYGRGRPAIRPAWRKCLFLYFYFLDPHFGLLHVRLQTWFPFTIQVYVNAHEWLVRELLSVELLRSTDGSFRVAAIYRNEPKVEVRQRSPIHYGGMLLTVQGEPPSRLEGHYWTDRNTRGDLILEGVIRALSPGLRRRRLPSKAADVLTFRARSQSDHPPETGRDSQRPAPSFPT